MRNLLLTLLMLATIACSDTAMESDQRELAHIQVHEWGVLTWNGGTAVLSSVPGTPAAESVIPGLPSNHGEMLLRAPVLYFNGPAFSGTVTVKTNNGSIFDIYPIASDQDQSNNHCTWRIDCSYTEIEEYTDFHGMAPGEWNYDLWRDVYAMTVSMSDGWKDKFLYYETAPSTTDFLPYRPGMESLSEEYMNVNALVIRRLDDGIYFSHCTLRDVVYGEDIEYLDMTQDAVREVLYSWSIDLINIDEVDALWNTWSSWMLREYVYDPGYDDGLVLYMIPADLTEKLSTISVTPDTPFPVDISRYLIVA
ncbi:MAG: hypothetical protein U9P42_09605, partial [Candidatus Fermentibacteria bacterium]|nr:hypothetical protein [Candidatus Fermentibacteria bacterium]